jgi:hypothetical protein
MAPSTVADAVLYIATCAAANMQHVLEIPSLPCRPQHLQAEQTRAQGTNPCNQHLPALRQAYMAYIAPCACSAEMFLAAHPSPDSAAGSSQKQRVHQAAAAAEMACRSCCCCCWLLLAALLALSTVRAETLLAQAPCLLPLQYSSKHHRVCCCGAGT